MNIEKFTQKSQEALQEAQALAIRMCNPQLEGEHLLAALMDQDGGLIPSLLGKMQAPVEGIRKSLAAALGHTPRVSGPGADAGSLGMTRRFQGLLVQAEEVAAQSQDEFVSVEHLFTAILNEGKSTPA